MSSNEINKKRKKIAESQERNDVLVNRLMIVFVAAVIVVTGLLAYRNGVNRAEYYLYRVSPFLAVGFGIITVVCGIWFAKRRKSGADDSMKVITASGALITSATIFAMFLLYSFIGIKGMVGIVIIMTVLAFIYSFYPRDFFALSVLAAVGAAVLYAEKLGMRSSTIGLVVYIIVKLIALAAAAGAIITALKLAKNGGVISYHGKKVKLLRSDYSYVPAYVLAGIILAASILSIFLPMITIYAIIVLFAAYLVFAIVYTLKMVGA